MEKWRRLVLILTLGAGVVVFVLPLNPVGSKLLKLIMLGAIFGGWVGATVLFWRIKDLRLPILLPPVIVFGFLLLPGREISPTDLRRDYVRALESFEGVDYVWGGESPRGIDCSGLPRRALRQALLRYALRKHSSEALRQFLEHWWHDASARALSGGYREFTVPLEKMASIREGDYSGLLPGDLAVTGNGTHLIVYLGEEKWIQADPGPNRVWTQNARTERNRWFDIPVTMHRWKVLAQP